MESWTRVAEGDATGRLGQSPKSESEFFNEQGQLEPPPPPPPPPAQARTPSVPPNLTPGLCIANKYELVRKVGSGAMGEVWAAKHLSLKEEVAIKIVMRDVAHEDGSSTDSRFLLEARVASQLSRKTRHIVSVTDHGEDGPYAYLVMELLNGESLDARLARTGPMPLKKVIPLVYQVARALAVAHTDGIVHRDLKPSNIFVTVDEEGKALIKILDFGIAKMRGGSMRHIPVNHVSMSAAKHATLRGFLLGTPAYMSPEQARGRQIDHRADVWALAVISYHLLTTQYPFDGETSDELFTRLCRVEPIPITIHRTDLPAAIVDLFARAFSKRLDQRFQSAVAFAGALEQIETIQRRLDGTSPMPLSPISLPPPMGDEGNDGDDNGEDDAPRERIIIDDIPRDGLARISAPPKLAAKKKAKTHDDDSTITPAGVPSKRKTWTRAVVAVAVIALLLGLGNVISTWRDEAKPRGLAAGATNIEPSGRDRDRRSDDEAIPAPDPNIRAASQAATTPPEVRPQDLPPAAAVAPVNAAPPPPPTAPQVVTTTASLPPDPPPPAMASPQSSPARSAPKRVDRSEVF